MAERVVEALAIHENETERARPSNAREHQRDASGS